MRGHERGRLLARASAGGATVVSVLAHGAWPGGLRCRFGEASASAGWSGGSFYYHAPMTASGVAPAVGPERGGTRVAVLGGGFRDAYTLRCAFGSAAAPVLARYVDESQLECVTPVHAAGSFALLLSMNGQQYAPSGASSAYQPSASVSYISP